MRTIILLILLLASNLIHAQANSESAERAVLASYYIPELDLSYETANGQASANMLLSCFRNFKHVPALELNLAGNDQANCNKLIAKLNSLLANPPSWNDLFLLERKKVLDEDKAMHRVPKYKLGN